MVTVLANAAGRLEQVAKCLLDHAALSIGKSRGVKRRNSQELKTLAFPATFPVVVKDAVMNALPRLSDVNHSPIVRRAVAAQNDIHALRVAQVTHLREGTIKLPLPDFDHGQFLDFGIPNADE